MMLRHAIGMIVALVVVFAVTRPVVAMTLFPAHADIFLQPGAAVTKYLSVFNDQDGPIAIQTRISLFHDPAGTGHPIFYDQVAAGLPNPLSWISTPVKPLVLNAGELAVLPITVSVPADTPPGGYYAAAFAHAVPDRGKTTAVAEVGSLLFITVAGTSTPQVDMTDFFFTPGHNDYPGHFSVKISNKGTVHVSPVGSVQIRNILGKEIRIPFNPEQLRVLPNTTRQFVVPWGITHSNKWWERERAILLAEWKYQLLGPLTITAVVDEVSGGSSASITRTVWVWPWRTGTIVIVALFCLILLTHKRRKRRYLHVVAK